MVAQTDQSRRADEPKELKPKRFAAPGRIRTLRYMGAFLAGPILFTALVALAVRHIINADSLEAIATPLLSIQLGPLPAAVFTVVLLLLVALLTSLFLIASWTRHESKEKTALKRVQQALFRVVRYTAALAFVALIAIGLFEGRDFIVVVWFVLLVISLLIWLLAVAPWANPKRRDVDRFWSQGSFVVTILTMLALVVILGLTPKVSFSALLGCWLTTLGLLSLLVIYVGYVRNDRLLGIFIDTSNRVSLSYFQILIWTMLIASTFLALALGNISGAPLNYTQTCTAANGCILQVEYLDNATLVHQNYMNALNISIPPAVLALAGIAATSLVVPPFLVKAKKEAHAHEVCEALTSWINRQFVPRQDDFARLNGGRAGMGEHGQDKLIDLDSIDCQMYRNGSQAGTQIFPQTVNCRVDVNELKQRMRSICDQALALCEPCKSDRTPATSPELFKLISQLRNSAQKTIETVINTRRLRDLDATQGPLISTWSRLVTKFALATFTFNDLEAYQRAREHQEDLEQLSDEYKLQLCKDELRRMIGPKRAHSVTEWIDAFNRIFSLLVKPSYVESLYETGSKLQEAIKDGRIPELTEKQEEATLDMLM